MNGVCACCGEPGKILAHGWREACYFRWYRAGKPKAGPPPRRRMRKADRQAEYAFLRDAGEERVVAARRVGLRSNSKVHEYERAWKAVA